MTERPILFGAEMVRAILDGRKTQTRRVCNPQPEFAQRYEWKGRELYDGEARQWFWKGHDFGDGDRMAATPGPEMVKLCPYGAPGDRLWVRETFFVDDVRFLSGPLPKERPADLAGLYYRADGECCDQIPECECDEYGGTKWRPSIHMPRWASRIDLEVTGVRVERVQDISQQDAKAEGCSASSGIAPAGAAYDVGSGYTSARYAFCGLWDSLNAKRGYSWAANPWVWVVEFRVLRPTTPEAT